MTAIKVEDSARVWLGMIACGEGEESTGCAGFCALTLGVAWLRTVTAWSGCEVRAEATTVEDVRPASILYASLGTAHWTTTPTEPAG